MQDYQLTSTVLMSRNGAENLRLSIDIYGLSQICVGVSYALHGINSKSAYKGRYQSK